MAGIAKGWTATHTERDLKELVPANGKVSVKAMQQQIQTLRLQTLRLQTLRLEPK